MNREDLEKRYKKLEKVNKQLRQKIIKITEEKEKYRSFFEKAEDVLLMISSEGYISLANPKFFEITGYSPRELKKLPFTSFLHPDDTPLLLEHFKKRLAGEKVKTSYQFRVLTKEKRILWVEGNFRLVEKEGKIIGIESVVRDITERKLIEDTINRKVNELNVLYNTIRKTTTSLNLDETLAIIAENSANLLKVDASLIRLLDTKEKILKTVKAYNLKEDSPAVKTIKLGKGVLNQVVLKKKPVAIEDIQKNPHYLAKEWAKKEGFISFLGVPLYGKKKVIGTLSFLSRTKHTFQKEEISLALTFAGEAAIAIENATLVENLKKQLSRMKALSHTIRKIATSLELGPVLDSILANSVRLFDADAALIRLLDPEKNILKIARAYNLNPEELGESILKLGEGVVSEAILKRKPVAVEDIKKEPRFFYKKWAIEKGYTSALFVPLEGKEKTIGALCILSKKKHFFDEEEISLASIFAGGAAVTIENARLFEENVKLSITDPLTGLYNTRYFYDNLKKEIARVARYGGSTSLVMFDLDNFKNYNDLYGHQAGDYVLREVAQRMLRCCRQTDILARYGGDEFIILLPRTDQKGAFKLAERIRSEIEKIPFGGRKGEFKTRITVSGSIITHPQDGAGVEDLMRKVDTLLYAAKWIGENRILSPFMINLEFIQDLILEKIDRKDHYTRKHSERVANYATTLARKINLDERQIGLIKIASLVHDVGKIGVPEAVLTKPGKLNKEEMDLIRAHPKTSVEIIRLSPLSKEIIPMVLHHHERWDGNGYPQGLKGEEIPLGARIIHLANAYDAMTVKRVYRDRMKPEEALEEIKRLAGSQFDPALVEAFIKGISG